MPPGKRSSLSMNRLACAVSLAISAGMLLPQAAEAASGKKNESKQGASRKVAATAKAEPRKLAARQESGRKPAAQAIHVTIRKPVVRAAAVAAAAVVAAKPSFGKMAGLHAVQDPLDLKSSVALVIDQDTQEVLLSKNDDAVLPIASLTKLMTGLLISEARLPMDELITITQDDVDTEKWSSSRLTVGSTLSREEMLHLALMSSENRAAHALGRTYPGGLATFVTLMNAKARMLGMADTRYVEPTGLSSRNQSSARDLAVLVNAAYSDATVRQLSTSPNYMVAVGQRTLQYNNTNMLVRNPAWNIGVQKTGFINEAGQCLVMQAKIAGRKLIMVFLDSAGKLSRVADAERVRRWVESNPSSALALTKHIDG
ncbi:MAG: D-alanyl-D-alanine endopeptidase [Xylophilus ampelinus]